MGRELPVTVTLAKIIEKSFPSEYAERSAERLGRSSMDAQEPPLPLFVMATIFPGCLPSSVLLCASPPPLSLLNIMPGGGGAG